jgi:hypothetical protein
VVSFSVVVLYGEFPVPADLTPKPTFKGLGVVVLLVGNDPKVLVEPKAELVVKGDFGTLPNVVAGCCVPNAEGTGLFCAYDAFPKLVVDLACPKPTFKGLGVVVLLGANDPKVLVPLLVLTPNGVDAGGGVCPKIGFVVLGGPKWEVPVELKEGVPKGFGFGFGFGFGRAVFVNPNPEIFIGPPPKGLVLPPNDI